MKSSIHFHQTSPIKKILEDTKLYAQSPWPVLIQGETGVGKELVAREIHAQSPRQTQPWIPLNCGAVPSGVFESELFGHEKGAFSGATQPNRGLLRQCHRGTLFLDELGELCTSLQVKLLRFLETGEVRSVGGTRFDTVDVRIVAATNVDLHEEARKKKFRVDLLQRLSVLVIQMPPLRQRPEDIPILAQTIAFDMEAKISQEALSLLQSYDWPGNVRQLKNVLIRASIESHQQIEKRDIEKSLAKESQLTPGPPTNETQTLANMEKEVIVRVLKQCGGNRKQAAKELGIAKSTLHEKLRRWRKCTQAVHWPVGYRTHYPYVAESKRRPAGPSELDF